MTKVRTKRLNRAEKQAVDFLRDARMLRRNAVGFLRHGRCRHADPSWAARELGRAEGVLWNTENFPLRVEIAAELRKIRNLVAAYERRCVGRERTI
jgi:hypothetical protein